MLDGSHQAHELDAPLDLWDCEIDLPQDMRDFFDARGPVGSHLDDRRRFPRFNLRRQAAFEGWQTLPGRPREKRWYRVYTKDFSRQGIAFLHHEELYPREQGRLLIPGEFDHKVEVVRCRRLGAHCYEIGACFVDEAAPANS